jgi:hypothetical protein
MFDRSSSGISPFQGLRLAAAVQELQSGGDGLIGIGWEAPGVDTPDISGSGGADTTASAGKYISDNAFLEVQQGVTSGSAKATLEVELTPSLSAETQIGQEGVPAPASTGLTTIEGQGQEGREAVGRGGRRSSLRRRRDPRRTRRGLGSFSPLFGLGHPALAQVRRLVLGHHSQPRGLTPTSPAPPLPTNGLHSTGAGRWCSHCRPPDGHDAHPDVTA